MQTVTARQVLEAHPATPVAVRYCDDDGEADATVPSLAVALLALCYDVGLLSEEYDPAARLQLGNFPQALSHIALVNSAFNLSQARKPAHQRATATS